MGQIEHHHTHCISAKFRDFWCILHICWQTFPIFLNKFTLQWISLVELSTAPESPRHHSDLRQSIVQILQQIRTMDHDLEMERRHIR